jgi:hypothetical protein
MSASTVNVPANISLIPVDTRVVRKILFLPTVSTNAGRFLSFKDYYGTSSNSSFTISTTGTDLIDDYNSSYTFSNAWGSLALVSDGLRSWRMMNLYNGGLTPAASSGFSPTQISGLQLWLDGSDASTLSLSGTTVTQWRDKSGIGNNTTATGGTNTYTTNAINGLSAVKLNNSWLTGGLVTSYTGNQVQAFGVGTLTTSAGAYGRMLSLGRPGVNDFNSTDTTFMFIRNTGQNIMVGRNGSYLSVNLPAYSTPFLVQASQNSNIEFIGLNGTLTPSSQNTGVTGNLNLTSYGIGTNTNTADATYWDGFVGEILYYTGAFTTLQIQQIEGYLAWKWGLQGNLPASHPYKNAPP